MKNTRRRIRRPSILIHDAEYFIKHQELHVLIEIYTGEISPSSKNLLTKSMAVVRILAWRADDIQNENLGQSA
jgi:hypothetical protein